MGSMGACDTGGVTLSAGTDCGGPYLFIASDDPIDDVLRHYAPFGHDVVMLRRSKATGIPPEVDCMGKTIHGLRCYQVDVVRDEVVMRWRRA